MGNKKGHHDAQSLPEMLDSMSEAKEQALSPRRGQSIYKKESGEYQEEKLKDLIALNLNELGELATKERVALEDINEVKKRSVIYLRACQETSTFPSSLGLARSLGYSDRALRHWRSKQPNTATAQWLEIFNDMCADILSQSALKNNANNIMAIFLNKALYEMRETSELVVTPNARELDTVEYSAEDIRRRYMMDCDSSTDEQYND